MLSVGDRDDAVISSPDVGVELVIRRQLIFDTPSEVPDITSQVLGSVRQDAHIILGLACLVGPPLIL